jgi:hypothetical protein
MVLTLCAFAATSFLPAAAQTAVTVPWALRNTVDTDGDGVNDLVDNAPGAFDPSQVDTDADLIGDIIDPTPVNSNPFLGDPGLGFGGPYTIPAGSSVAIDYLMTLGTPPGGWGYIDLDFGGNGVYDATYFGPLTASVNQITIAPGLFVDPTWNLNVAGNYTVHAKAFGPGMHSQFDTITDVKVIPEPAGLVLGMCAAMGLSSVRRRARVVTLRSRSDLRERQR